MNKKLITIIVLLLALLAQPLAPAQAQENTIALYLETVDTTAFPEVTVRLTAWGSDGLPLQGLTPRDFTLQEDQGAPFHPTSVVANTQATLRVALVIDVSGSMQGKPLEDAQIAAARFLDRLTAGDYAALVAFSEIDPDPTSLNPEREIAFTSNLTPLYDRIEALKASGATHLYNAVAKAVQLFGEQPSGHRAILLLSDGRNDPASEGDPEQPIQLAQEYGVPVFVIGMGSQIDEPYLRRLAADTGGLYRSALTSSELAAMFADMASLLKTQYELTYTSVLPADGQAHTLSLELQRAGGSAAGIASMGPLPLVEATAAPTAVPPTETPLPIPSATPLPEPTQAQPVQPALVATPPAEDNGISPVVWVAGILGLLVLAVIVIALLFRKKPPVPEVCAKCGFDLTGKAGPCPSCGETRRLPKLKK